LGNGELSFERTSIILNIQTQQKHLYRRYVRSETQITSVKLSAL